MAFLKTASDLPMPDIQLLCSAAPLTAAPYFRPFVAPYEDSFACRAVLLRPESRGQITPAPRDPKQAPRIKQNFLAREKDWATLRAAVKLAREIGRQSALAPFVAAETGPGPDRRSDSEVDAYIRATAITVHHPLGTCKMGSDRDPDAVVDAECKVRGVEGLRIVDASVMPDLVGGNINAPVIMIAEKAADMIRGREPLARSMFEAPVHYPALLDDADQFSPAAIDECFRRRRGWRSPGREPCGETAAASGSGGTRSAPTRDATCRRLRPFSICFTLPGISTSGAPTELAIRV